MKKNYLLLITFFMLTAFCMNAATTPAEDLLNRIGGAGTSERILTSIEPSADSKEYFTITSESGKPKIIGDSYLSVATGIHWYLKYNANVLLTWNNLTTDLSAVTLPVPATAETRSTSLKYRYYLNYCTYSYTMAFWDWERWEKEIDWMAMHGINMPLALTGTEVVWRNVLVNKLGYSKTEANEFIAGSGFQAWFLMNNLEGWGGPNPDSWYDQQEALQKKIVARMRELNIEPVFAGYSGMVPSNIATKKGWNISNPGTWCSFQRPGFLLPTDANFNEMAQYYYDEMRTLYGTSRYYSMDPFHEGGNVSGVNLDAAYKAIYNAMKNYSGNAVTPQWVLQSWNENPRQQALDALEPGTLIVLDLFSDGVKRWGNSYKQSDGDKHQFVFCMLSNFGGRTGLHGRIEKTIDEFYEAKAQFPETMLGIGTTMEGSENNPVLYESVYELAWRNTKTPADEWIKGYAKARYGAQNDKTEEAWQLLMNSIYKCTTGQQGVSESLLCARPSLDAGSVSTWSTSAIYYNVDDVREAAYLLLSQKDVLSGSNYEYDVVDAVRQTLADYANGLLKRIKKANTDGNTKLRNALMDRFLEVIIDQDKLMNTIPDFMLGRWINDARSLGTTQAEKDLYEKNARLQVSTWGPLASANSSGLHDYSNREWGGLLKDYYYKRWKLYFDRIKAGTSTPNSTEFFNMEYEWATTPTTTEPYPFVSQSDPLETAAEVFGKYYAELMIEGANSTTILLPVENTADFTSDVAYQVNAYRSKTLKVNLLAQPLMKVYIDFNGDGSYSENEKFSPVVNGSTALFTINIPANAQKGRKDLLLYTDIAGGSIDFGTTALCGLRFSSSLLVMDEITSPRTITVAVDDEKKGTVAIDGQTGNTVTTTDIVVVRATRKIGYAFKNWTNESGTILSTENPFSYYEKESVTLTANFEEKGETTVLPAGENYTTFDPPLSTSDKWRIDAEITVFGESFNQWGSSLFTEGNNAFDGYKFQYYLKSGGEIMLNNSVNIDNIVVDQTNGTKFSFEVVSDGSGTVQTRVSVGDKSYDWYPYTLPTITYISKATKYPLSISVIPDDDTNSLSCLQAPDVKVYGKNGKITIEGLRTSDVCRVFTISGYEVNKETILPTGIYIVMVNNVSYKIIL
nr:alpha-N-acetylglucosaminidase [Paludibacter sp. 221]